MDWGLGLCSWSPAHLCSPSKGHCVGGWWDRVCGVLRFPEHWREVVEMLAGWLGGSWDKEMSKSDLKQGLWETPTGESGIVCVLGGMWRDWWWRGWWEGKVLDVWLCGSGWGPATGPEDTKHTHINTQRDDTQTTPITACISYIHTHAHTYRVCTHLSVIVEVPQVQAAHAIHGSKHGRVHGRPHDIIHIIGVVFKRVQRLVVLKERRKKRGYLCERVWVTWCEKKRRRSRENAESDGLQRMTYQREREKELREGVRELQTEWRCLSLGACLGAEPN